MPNLTTFQIALTVVTVLGLGLILWKGHLADRLAGLGLCVLEFGTPFLDSGQRLGVALISGLVLLLLIALALRVQRWWIIGAAGLQLTAFGTHVVFLAEPDSRLWAGVTVRLAIWVLLMLLAIFGACEARCAPYATNTRHPSAGGVD